MRCYGAVEPDWCCVVDGESVCICVHAGCGGHRSAEEARAVHGYTWLCECSLSDGVLGWVEGEDDGVSCCSGEVVWAENEATISDGDGVNCCVDGRDGGKESGDGGELHLDGLFILEE